MKHILVPTDFSETAGKALDYAARLSVKCGAVVHVLHAYILLESEFVERRPMRDAWNEQQKQEKAAELLRLKQDILERFPNVAIETHLYTGPTEDVLLHYANKVSIDFVIMGTQGASGLAEVLVGSVTAAIMRKSRIPVLGIPSQYEPDGISAMVLATRRLERDERILQPIFGLAALFDIPLEVLVFADENDADVETVERSMQLDAHIAYLHSVFPLARLQARLMEGHDFETAIQDYCEERGIGILCMITYPRGFWEQWLHPSMTRKMAYHTRVPLLAVPA